MFKFAAFFALLIPSGVLAHITHWNCATPEPPTDQSALRDFAQETNQFGFDLLQKLRQQPGNLFVSPYSISSALAMTAAGARGQTAEQITMMLGMPAKVSEYAGLHQALMASLLDKPKGYDIRIANALWGDNLHPFKADFINQVQRSFRAEARTMDFTKEFEASRETINQWVEAQTNNRIKNLLLPGSVTSATKLVLTNAIYFKGAWEKPFEKRGTRIENFYPSGNQPIKTEMMHRFTDLNYAASNDLHCVELPYVGSRLSMVVLLPKQKQGLAEVEAGMTAIKLKQLLRHATMKKVNLSMPRFKMDYMASLTKTLPLLGMTDAFVFGKADFSRIDGTRELIISDVVHKAFCEVSEEGTEAAAATGVIMAPGSAALPQSTIEFTADQPFLFLIRDMQTGSILFLGRLANPKQREG